MACQDRANTKAAYRFLSNRRANESAILAGHFQATRERAIAASWRIFWMTMMNRLALTASPLAALTSTETHVLDLPIKDNRSSQSAKPPLNCYLTKIAKLGGYLVRTKDPPPGNTVMWRGIARLTDIELGFIIASGLVGN